MSEIEARALAMKLAVQSVQNSQITYSAAELTAKAEHFYKFIKG